MSNIPANPWSPTELPQAHVSRQSGVENKVTHVSTIERTKSGRPRLPKRLTRFYRIPWWVAILFTIGCIFFTAASAMSYGQISDLRYMQILHINLAGASCFLVGGFLGLIETLMKIYQKIPDKADTIEDASEASSESESAKPETIDVWITAATFVGTIFFEIPGIVAYFSSAEWNWTQKLFYLNIHTILGVVFFDVYSFLTFKKIFGHVITWSWENISFYAPAFYLAGGFPFIVYAILANLDVYPQDAAVSMALIGSVLYLVGSVAMMIEIALYEEEK